MKKANVINKHMKQKKEEVVFVLLVPFDTTVEGRSFQKTLHRDPCKTRKLQKEA